MLPNSYHNGVMVIFHTALLLSTTEWNTLFYIQITITCECDRDIETVLTAHPCRPNTPHNSGTSHLARTSCLRRVIGRVCSCVCHNIIFNAIMFEIETVVLGIINWTEIDCLTFASNCVSVYFKLCLGNILNFNSPPS